MTVGIPIDSRANPGPKAAAHNANHRNSPARFVYIASPYTIGDVAVNVRQSLDCASALAEAGYIPCAPLLTHFWHFVHPRPYEFWIAYCLEWLSRCDAVLRLPGESKGADGEVARARELGLPVVYSLAELQGLSP